MHRYRRHGLLLAAGLSLAVHAAAAIYFGYLAQTADGIREPSAQVVLLSLNVQRAPVPTPVQPVKPPPQPPQETPPPEPVAKPLPRPKPEPRSRPPARPRPAPVAETVAALPQETAAPVEAAIVPPPAAAAAPAPSARESYLARLLAHIDSHKFYPRGARQRGQEGEVHVAFQLLQDGGIRALEVSGSSRLLREAAERAVQDALPLPQPPESVDLRDRFSFSMQFRLKG